MSKMKNVIGKFSYVQMMSAIAWAAVMIGCSLVLKENESAERILNILLAGAALHLLLLSKGSGKSKKCIQP